MNLNMILRMILRPLMNKLINKGVNTTKTGDTTRPGQGMMQRYRLGAWSRCNNAWLYVEALEILLELTY